MITQTFCNQDVRLCDEYEAIKLWAWRNTMILNASMTKEIVFAAQIADLANVLPALKAIEKIKETKLVDVIFFDSFHL